MSEKYRSLTTKKIGQRMRLCRKQSGLSQAETCTLLNISQSSLSRIESGSLRPTDEQIDLFLNRLKIEPDYFLTDENFSMKIVGVVAQGFRLIDYPKILELFQTSCRQANQLLLLRLKVIAWSQPSTMEIMRLWTPRKRILYF